MRVIKFFLSPLLLLAIIATSLYFGVARPGAVGSIAQSFVSQESVRNEIAHQVVNQLVTSDDEMIKSLISRDRTKAQTAIANSIAQEQEQREIADAAEKVSAAAFSGRRQVTIDAKPIYRPIYQGIDAVFPILKLEQTQLKGLEPITLGSERGLPNLKPVRVTLLLLLLLWPLWIFLAFFYAARRRPTTVAVQTLVISGVSLVITLALPLLAGKVISQPLQDALVQIVLRQSTELAMWISLVLVITSSGALLLIRKRVMARQDAS